MLNSIQKFWNDTKIHYAFMSNKAICIGGAVYALILVLFLWSLV